MCGLNERAMNGSVDQILGLPSIGMNILTAEDIVLADVRLLSLSTLSEAAVGAP